MKTCKLHCTLKCLVWSLRNMARSRFYFDKLAVGKIGEAAFVFNAVIDADKIQVHLPTLEMMQMNQASPCSSRTKNGQFQITFIVNVTDVVN